MKGRPVELTIDELVLDGMAGLDGPAVARAVQTELARLLADRGLPGDSPRPRRVEWVSGGTVPDAVGGPAARGARIARIARAIYDGIAESGSWPGTPSPSGEPPEGE